MIYLTNPLSRLPSGVELKQVEALGRLRCALVSAMTSIDSAQVPQVPQAQGRLHCGLVSSAMTCFSSAQVPQVLQAQGRLQSGLD